MTLSAPQQESIEISMLLKSEWVKELSRMLWLQYYISQTLAEHQTKVFSFASRAPVPADVEVYVGLE